MDGDTAPPPRDVVAETPPAPGAKKTLGTTKRSAPSNVSVSLSAILDLENDVHKGKGTYHSGSLVPDTRFYVLAVCTFFGRIFSAADYEASQFVTPPSLIAYSLLVLYFLLFHRDMHSKSPSQHARNFTDFARYNQLLKLMDNVYIPDEIFAILQNFVSFAPDLIPNLQFVPSLASAILEYDAGYLLHPAIFLHGHNTLFNRADALGHFSRFLSQNIANLSLVNGNTTIAARNYRIANFLGCVYSTGNNAGNGRLVQNWLSRVILPFVDPATHRQHLRRTGISKYDLGVPTFTSANWNPYQYLFSTTVSSSFESTLDCLHACSEFCRDQFKASKTLSQLYTAANPAPGSYMIMAYSTPTWTLNPIPDNNFPEGLMDSGDFATLHDSHTYFGPAPTAATTNANNLTMPVQSLSGAQAARQAAIAAGVTASLNGFIGAIYGAENHADPDSALPAQLSLETRNEMKHSQPDMLVFAPSDSTVSAAQHPILSGIIVHNGNIDSTIVRTPNVNDELPQIRSRYIDGFVSLRVIRPRFMNRPTWLVMRQALERMSYSTINLLWRSDIIGLPRYDVAHNAPATGAAANLFWPFTIFRRVTQMIFGTNVAVSEPPVEPANPAWMQVGDAWSSFRLTSDSNARPTSNNTFFGINHGEVIFGRNSTLNKFSHPADLLRRN